MNLPLLKSLSEAPGVPGREERVRAILEKESQGLFDETTTDNLGSLIAVKRSKTQGAKKVLLACHIDEIGFYVKHIDDKTGHLRLNAAGGFDTRNLLARRMKVQASSGEDLIGLMNPGGRPIHIAKEEDKKKIPEVTEFFVDLCLPADEVKKKVRIGDPVTLVQEFSEIGNCVSGKCLDNRVAAFVAIEALRKATNPKYDVPCTTGTALCFHFASTNGSDLESPNITSHDAVAAIASPGHFSSTATASALTTIFASIASDIASGSSRLVDDGF